MADQQVKQVKVVVAGDASGAKAAFNETESASASVASKIKSHFAGVFSALSNNPALSGITGMFSELSGTFDGLSEKSENLSDKVTKVGLAAAGVGGALTMMSQGDQQASQQLAAAFQDAGYNIDDYKDKIDGTVKSMANFGYNSEEAQGALQTLVQATGNPTKALNDMGLAANLAAARHESLGTAATQVAEIMQGKGTRTFAEFGITITANEKKTGNYSAAIAELSKKVGGQASAASDTLKGKMEALRAEVENHVSEFGQKYGPTITAAGAVMGTLGATINTTRSIMEGLRGTTEAATSAQEALSGAQEAGEVAADGMAAGETAADAAGLPLIATIGLIVAAVALVVVGIYELVTHWKTVFATMKTVVEDCWNFINSTFIQPIETAFKAVVDFIQQHWQLLVGILLAPIAPVLALFLVFHDQIIGFFSDVVSFISRVPGQIVNFFSSVPGAIVNFFENMPQRIMDMFSGIADKMASIGMDIVHGLVNGIESMGSAIWDAIKSHIPGGGIVGKALGAIGLAEGGIVTKPTLAMIGEAGYPEAVIPLKNGATAMGFNESVQQLTQGMFAQAGQTNQNSNNQTTVNIAAITNANASDIASEVTWSLGRLAS